MTSDRQIAWTALERGAAVRSRDGDALGTVAEVVADESKDIFSGLAVDTGAFKRTIFVPADRIVELTEAAVTLDLVSDELEDLEPYK
jgi:uncharacterized protein YrrD